MSIDVLQVFRRSAIDVARNAKVVVILGIADLGQRHHARIARNFNETAESIDNLMNVLRAQAILVAVLNEALGSINHENSFAGCGVLLIQHYGARRNSGSIKEIWREPNNSFDVTAPDNLAANDSLSTAAKEDAVRKIHRCFAG